MKATAKEKSQVEKFRDLARKLETVDSEEPLNEALRRVTKRPAINDKPTKKNNAGHDDKAV
ncbi:hypothetical protein CN311_19210 [Mesorhizobium sanjuanii]|uniref:Uncharacterized protein n=1 Tax=Mesorhizobium sanjuanii TaxID=2037900 RepID=A0A2A6FCW7_9HYPH|nr:hypothetical protein [Mesorhizobium sanjuanii]PDQ19481.1 hypothetical protein CN311_19210 [Mesorhizobium sanjuanii]